MGKLLKIKKELFELTELTKLFQNSFQEGRTIFMISHEFDFSELMNYRKQMQNDKNLKEIPFVMMLIQNSFRIQAIKYKEHQEKIERKFKDRYGRVYETEVTDIIDEHKKQKTVVFLRFNCYAEAIYAYMICESLLLKPYFPKN